MTMMWMWQLYLLFVVFAFLWFGREWIRHPSRWHIGAMSLSYTLLCILVASFDYASWNLYQSVVAVGAMSIGLVGLSRYVLEY